MDRRLQSLPGDLGVADGQLEKAAQRVEVCELRAVGRSLLLRDEFRDRRPHLIYLSAENVELKLVDA